jgi:hypothetical protein
MSPHLFLEDGGGSVQGGAFKPETCEAMNAMHKQDAYTRVGVFEVKKENPRSGSRKATQ